LNKKDAKLRIPSIFRHKFRAYGNFLLLYHSWQGKLEIVLGCCCCCCFLSFPFVRLALSETKKEGGLLSQRGSSGLMFYSPLLMLFQKAMVLLLDENNSRMVPNSKTINPFI
jgi:hypothetical protein